MSSHTARIAARGGNVIEVTHRRLFAAPSVQAAELKVMVEAHDAGHAMEIAMALEGSYTVRQA